MKNICMFNIGDIYGKQTGGVKRFKELYFYLKESGYDVDLYCASPKNVLRENGITGAGIIELKGKYKGIFNIPSHAIYKNNQNLYKSIKERQYDAVISFDVPSTIGLCLAKMQNVYYFVRQDLIQYRKIQYEDKGMNAIKKWILLFAGWFMEWICVSRSYRIISQCQYDLDHIKKRHKLSSREIERKSYIQINNVNPSWIKENNGVADGFSDDNEKVYDLIYVGNFDDDRKGYRLFLDAYGILRDRNIKLKAIMLGDGVHKKECEERHKDDNIAFSGFVRNVGDYIRKSYLMVVPSYADSCPNTIMESLQKGTPVIGADSSGIPEILNDKQWRFALNAESLADKIQDILKRENYDKCKAMQKKRTKELTFNWGESIEKILLEKIY